jgi:dipeptidyl aminopeptidase/acylaminoacyl peptidase
MTYNPFPMTSNLTEIQVKSSLDGSLEPVLFAPHENKQAPLLVGLHTWSADRFNQQKWTHYSEQQGWHLLLPEFRGPNLVTNPRASQACASELAQQDILDAVAHVRGELEHTGPVFLLGGSGGGHMSLMMAAKAPELWTAVSSWCPITDLRKWRLQNPNYRPHIEACCGGVPEDSEEVAQQYSARSPIDQLEGLSKAHVFIHHGKTDASVPFSHTMELYNALIAQYPDAEVYSEIFPGTHECHSDRAVKWFADLLEKQQATELTG